MDEFVIKADAMALPVVMLLIVMGTRGLFGAAAITTADLQPQRQWTQAEAGKMALRQDRDRYRR